jgi:hypothetical protein
MTEKVSDTKIKKIKDLKAQHPDWGCRRIAKAVNLHYVTVSKKLKETGLNQPEKSPKRNSSKSSKLSHSINPAKPSPNWEKILAKSEKSFGTPIPARYQEKIKRDDASSHSVKPELKIDKTRYSGRGYESGYVNTETGMEGMINRLRQRYENGYMDIETYLKTLGLTIAIPTILASVIWGGLKLRDWLTARRAERERERRTRELANGDCIQNALSEYYEAYSKKMGGKEAPIADQKATEQWANIEEFVKHLKAPPDSLK